MRLWSLHPQYLDRQGLVACWREALLAQAVLAERTAGYRHHPQLERFRSCAEPLGTVGRYLAHLAQEATTRGYRFDTTRIDDVGPDVPLLPVTDGQLRFERDHLLAKLRGRTPERVQLLAQAEPGEAHPLFYVIPGMIEPWERP